MVIIACVFVICASIISIVANVRLLDVSRKRSRRNLIPIEVPVEDPATILARQMQDLRRNRFYARDPRTRPPEPNNG